jgi:2-oxoisovalerate dehydrogenase E1 component
MSDANQLHEKLRQRLETRDFAPGEPGNTGLAGSAALGIFRAQCMSRHLDRIARALQKAGKGYYTIGSSGHENMAAVAEAQRDDDMAFLHYRDAAFQLRRAMRIPGSTPLRDMLLSFACSSQDPISGGRHKVLGSRELAYTTTDLHDCKPPAKGRWCGVLHRYGKEWEPRSASTRPR